MPGTGKEKTEDDERCSLLLQWMPSRLLYQSKIRRGMEPKCEYSRLMITPQRLDFEVEEGFQFYLPKQYLDIKKVSAASNDMTPEWGASASEKWVSVYPRSGRGDKPLQVGVNYVGKPVGEHHAQITVKSDVTEVVNPTIEIVLTVKAKPEPEPPEPKPPTPPEPEPPTPPEPEPPEPEPPEPEPEPEPSWWEAIKKVIDWIMEHIFKK
jgi:hypothetical protein